MANFSSSDCSPHVIDTSVAISLDASGIADAVLGCLCRPALIVDIARDELDGGRGLGVTARASINRWERGGLLSIVKLSETANDTFESLVSGSSVATIDDGEAATIAHAIDVGGIAVVDEAKARKTSLRRFPDLSLSSATNLLLMPSLAAVIGPAAVADAVFKALTISRMRVPRELHFKVVSLIGEERAALCHSLPAVIRKR